MPITPRNCAFISAGEYSGDLLASELIQHLRLEFPKLEFFGVTGPSLKESRVETIVSMEELNVMGVIEVAKKATEIREIERKVLAWVDRYEPRFAVLVDFPGFHFRLAEQLHLRGIAVFQYVAPKVWAWGRGRLELLRRDFKKVLGVLPFEEEFFKKNGVPYEYIGSPHADRLTKVSVSAQDLGLPSDRPIIAFLPGSRMSEIERMIPHMVAIRQKVKNLMPNAHCVVAVAPSLSGRAIDSIMGGSELAGLKDRAIDAYGFWWLPGWSLELMKVASSAVVASGTATLECALAGTPMVVIYEMNQLSFEIAKRAVKLKWVSLVNLLMDDGVVTEHIQDINIVKVAEEVVALSSESPERRRMVEKFDELRRRLKPNAAMNAARAIKSSLGEA